MATDKDQAEDRKPTSSIDSSFPCELPEDQSLFLSAPEFEQHVAKTFTDIKSKKEIAKSEARLAELSVNQLDGKAFMDSLKTAEALSKMSEAETALSEQNKMFTENMDVAFKATGSALLDLFTELEKEVSGTRLNKLLEAAWKENALATLKIVWNARSIHLGKGEQESFYKCLGWMKNDHPITMISNLQWLYRAVIEKKVKKEDEDSMVVVDFDDTKKDLDEGFDVLHGVSHGYWKDLLNILVLAASGELEVVADPRDILHKKNDQPRVTKWERKQKRRKLQHRNDSKQRTDSSNATQSNHEKAPLILQQVAKDQKHTLEHDRHQQVLERFKDPFYRCLHFSVARLFAQKLQEDKKRLEASDSVEKSKISLAAKWAPSLEGFHDKHTLIATSIAEVLFPRDCFSPEDSRELYLKRAREAYRANYLSPLRRELDVVERKITEEAFSKINYSKVPSLAMDAYKNLFVKKDFEHYEKYIEKVAAGKARISGAILTPGSLVSQARTGQYEQAVTRQNTNVKALIEQKIASVLNKTLDGQWTSLVQRIKDNGTLANTMAICDVSGSMSSPRFPDGTCPLDHAVGLSLLIAEVTQKPFGGCFISFSANPQVHNVTGTTLSEKVSNLESSDWSMNTDFVAVFKRLILPIAKKHHIKQEDMVKQVIVFSDMHFDSAQGNEYAKTTPQWESSFERIKRKYAKAGYEMPRLIFWNLRGGNNGYSLFSHAAVAPKPVAKDEENCLMVSGYSQAMLKMFLDKGVFEEEEEEEMEVVTKDEDGDASTKTVKKKADPMSGVWRAIGHKAYDMLKVVD